MEEVEEKEEEGERERKREREGGGRGGEVSIIGRQSTTIYCYC